MNGQLSCSALKCVHNISGMCSANIIHISGSKAHTSAHTQCSTFAEKGLKNAITHMANINILGEIRQVFTKNTIEMNPYIRCEASNCAFNVEKLCSAGNVQIYGGSAETSSGTRCETFVE